MKQYTFLPSGLRFDREYLRKSYHTIKKFPIEEQSEFVDVVTYAMVQKGIPCFRESDLTNIDTTNYNTTSIGNVAFVALYHPVEHQKMLAHAILTRIRNS